MYFLLHSHTLTAGVANEQQVSKSRDHYFFTNITSTLNQPTQT